MIDILFLAHGRPEFTEAALAALRANTNWGLVSALWLYSDGSTGFHQPVSRFCSDFPFAPIYAEIGEYGSPVAVMNDYLPQSGSGLFCKIDSDVIVPPGWLDAALPVMESEPGLDLLGIEPPASRTPAPWAKGLRAAAPELVGRYVLKGIGKIAGRDYGYAPCEAIGGIGLMRRSAFAAGDLKPNGTYGGFTGWQIAHPEIRKGWIVPPLNLFLLDRLPFEPWLSLSNKYIAAGEQRAWTNYDPKDSALWEWWIQQISVVG